MKSLKVFILLLVVFFNCENEYKQTSFNVFTIENEYEAEITVNYDKASGNTVLANSINQNIENHIVETLGSEKENQNLSSILDNFNLEYLEFKRDFPDESDPKWELYIETEKTYQSNEIICLAINTYEFRGGAHGNDRIEFLNLDAYTGDMISNSEMIKDSIALKQLAKSYFIKELEASDDNLKIEDFFYGKPFHLPENIGYSEEGLIMLYNVYEIASYAQGYTEFVIPFEEVSELLVYH